MVRTRKVAGERDAIVVHEVTMVHLSTLNAAPYNPRTISPEMLESLKENIRVHGFVEPMVVQRVSPKYGPMVIVGGHQRQRALREICVEDNVEMPVLPAVVLDLDDRSAKLMNIALNKVSGEFDARLLGEVLEDIHHMRPIADEEVKLLGLEDDDLRKYLKLADPPRIADDDPITTFGQSVTLSLSFTDTKVRDAVKTKLAALAEAQKVSTGDVVMGLLERRKR
jgi:ParB-like chromosome segregation protein Spo0J